MTRRQVLRYNAISYRPALLSMRISIHVFQFHKPYYAIHHFNKHKILALSINFLKISHLLRTHKKWRNLRVNVEMTCPLVTQLYTILRKTAVFRERMNEIPPKFQATNIPKVLLYELYKIRIFKKSNDRNKARRQDDGSISEICRGCLSLKL